MRPLSTRAAACDRAQATVELAALLPMVLLFVMLLLQVGAVARDAVALTGAARAGARRAIVDPFPGAVRAAIVAETRLDPARLAVTIGGDTSPGGLVVVRVRYRSPTDVPLVGVFVDDVVMDERLVARRE